MGQSWILSECQFAIVRAFCSLSLKPSMGLMASKCVYIQRCYGVYCCCCYKDDSGETSILLSSVYIQYMIDRRELQDARLNAAVEKSGWASSVTLVGWFRIIFQCEFVSWVQRDYNMGRWRYIRAFKRRLRWLVAIDYNLSV
jgi:hypothetical protein